MRPAFLLMPNGSVLHCKLAETPEQRVVGLSRAQSVPLHGMLFDFGTPEVVSMTMRETAISLAMIFIDADGGVQRVVPQAVPGDPAPYTCPVPVRWVLETAPSVCERYGLRVGHSFTVLLPSGRLAA